MFRPLLAIFRLSSRELKVLLYIMCTHVMQRSLHPGMHTTAFNIEVNYYATKLGCRDLSITCVHIIYSRTLSSLEDNLKMASRGRNM